MAHLRLPVASQAKPRRGAQLFLSLCGFLKLKIVPGSLATEFSNCVAAPFGWPVHS